MDYSAEFDAPPQNIPTTEMPSGPLLGNGEVGVVLAGPPEAQLFYIGKNDFWSRSQLSVKTVGSVELSIPALSGATYHQEQSLARAEVRGTFAKDGLTVHTCSWVDATQGLLLTQVETEGAPVQISVLQYSGGKSSEHVAENHKPLNIGREQYGGGRWYFNGEIANPVVTNTLLTGEITGQPDNPEQYDGQTTWHEFAAPPIDKVVSVAAWIKIADISSDANYIFSKGDWSEAYSLGLSNGRLRWTINGTIVQTEQALEKNTWVYVVGTYDGEQMKLYVEGALKASLGSAITTGSFTRKADDQPGKSPEVAVVTRLIGVDGMETTIQPSQTITIATAIVSNVDINDFLATAQNLVSGLIEEKVESLASQHKDWWSHFWARSFIEIPDKEIEKRWYAALYVLGSCSREGKVAPGLWGNWSTTDNPAWNGDFHLNYNFQAPYYIVYSSNHADLSLPFYQAIWDDVANGQALAKSHGWKGVEFPVGIAPWGLSHNANDLDQWSNAAFAALNFIWQYQYTQDTDFLRNSAYPYLREVGDFWEDYLKMENGRYVINDDSIQENTMDKKNPILSLALVHILFENLIAMSKDLGVDADKRPKWQDILDHLSAYPLQQRDGKTVFRYTEEGTAWVNDNTLGIHPIFPCGAIGLDSDPKLLEISRNTIDEMARWTDSNGFSSWYTACARVGYDPTTILTHLRAECDNHSLPNLVQTYGGGGVENSSGFLAINEMLFQSYDGVLRFFPCWPKDLDARFGTLRARGAFLVSAEIKKGVIGNITIFSEKGRDCTVVNPWPGDDVSFVRNGKNAEKLTGNRFIFKTAPGETIQLSDSQL